MAEVEMYRGDAGPARPDEGVEFLLYDAHLAETKGDDFRAEVYRKLAARLASSPERPAKQPEHE